MSGPRWRITPARSPDEGQRAKIEIDWGWTSRVHLEDVAVSNADWGKADHMFKAKLIDFDVKLWPLIRGDIMLPRLAMRDPEIYLETPKAS
jgi:AsmA family protein